MKSALIAPALFTALFTALISLCVPAHAAVKSCDELKNEIEAKLKDHKVGTYSLEVVDADKAGEGKVVGSCEGGKKKIVYAKK